MGGERFHGFTFESLTKKECDHSRKTEGSMQEQSGAELLEVDRTWTNSLPRFALGWP